MAVFNQFITTLSINEGGYQNDSRDTGNYNSRGINIGTNHGISAPTLERYLGRVPTESDMRGLSLSTANNIFKIYFWDIINASNINNQAVAEIVADHSVNANPHIAIKILQRVLNKYFNANLVVDGINGNKTLQAINSANSTLLFQKYATARADYYRSLSKFSIFGKSWLNRLKVLSKKFSIKISIQQTAPIITVFLFSIATFLGAKYLYNN